MALGSTLAFVLCTISRALSLRAPSHHAPSPHAPFFLFAAGTFPFSECATILRVKCWRGCCAGCKHSARPPPHPILGNICLGFSNFLVLFRYRFRHPLFNGFFSFLPPFFQCFFNEFPMHFTPLFLMLFGYVLQKALLQNFIFFRRPPF